MAGTVAVLKCTATLILVALHLRTGAVGRHTCAVGARSGSCGEPERGGGPFCGGWALAGSR